MGFHTWIQLAKDTDIDHKIELFFKRSVYICIAVTYDYENPMATVFIINKINKSIIKLSK